MTNKISEENLQIMYDIVYAYLKNHSSQVRLGGYKEMVKLLLELAARMTKRFAEEECGKRFTSEETIKFVSNLTRVLWETCDDKINDMEV